jgi:hypothetical protein
MLLLVAVDHVATVLHAHLQPTIPELSQELYTFKILNEVFSRAARPKPTETHLADTHTDQTVL